jgi:hypothetical protein
VHGLPTWTGTTCQVEPRHCPRRVGQWEAPSQYFDLRSHVAAHNPPSLRGTVGGEGGERLSPIHLEVKLWYVGALGWGTAQNWALRFCTVAPIPQTFSQNSNQGQPSVV